METLTAIHSRQSISKVKEDAVPHELIEKLLAAAVQAPNHHRNRPWRFVVLTGKGRERLGDVMAQALAARNPDAPESALEVERRRPLRAPALVAVSVEKPTGEKIVDVEDICAGAAAVQNLLLAAHELGLGAIWRTGPAAYDPLVKAFFGLEPDQRLLAFVYVGYAEGEPPMIDRPSYEDYTVWMEG